MEVHLSSTSILNSFYKGDSKNFQIHMQAIAYNYALPYFLQMGTVLFQWTEVHDLHIRTHLSPL